MNRFAAGLLATSLAVAVAGCEVAAPTHLDSEPPFDPGDPATVPGLSIALLDTDALAGGTVRARLSNATEVPLGFNACGRSVERLAAGEPAAWVALPEELRICSAELARLEPGTSTDVALDVPLDATSGTHRFTLRLTELRLGGAQVLLISGAFQVR